MILAETASAVKNERMKKIVVLTGAGISAESGLSTFRDAGGLWDNYPVEQVATPEGWARDPALVTRFYNNLRRQLLSVWPSRAHELLARLEQHYDVTVVTQNVDDLHERAGSTRVIHLHGELMKVASSRDPDNPRYIRTLAPEEAEVEPGTLAPDGSLLRPWIVWFGEAVPNMEPACAAAEKADIFVVIGTSLNVYPAAGLVRYAPASAPLYVIDPKPVPVARSPRLHFFQTTASAGMEQLWKELVGDPE